MAANISCFLNRLKYLNSVKTERTTPTEAKIKLLSEVIKLPAELKTRSGQSITIMQLAIDATPRSCSITEVKRFIK
jgi:hypothetical protein